MLGGLTRMILAGGAIGGPDKTGLPPWGSGCSHV